MAEAASGEAAATLHAYEAERLRLIEQVSAIFFDYALLAREHQITAEVSDEKGRKNKSQFTRWVSGGRRPPAYRSTGLRTREIRSGSVVKRSTPAP